MPIVNICEAKSRLSKLVDLAAGGEDVVIVRAGKPVARITGLVRPREPIRLGVLKGKVRVAEDFDAPLPVTVQGAFEGR